jgi:hypothetical protein
MNSIKTFCSHDPSFGHLFAGPTRAESPHSPHGMNFSRRPDFLGPLYTH